MYLMVLKSFSLFSRNGGVSRDFICTKCIDQTKSFTVSKRFAGRPSWLCPAQIQSWKSFEGQKPDCFKLKAPSRLSSEG